MTKKNLQKQLQKYAKSIAFRLKRQVRIDRTIATGELLDSIFAEPSRESIDVFMADHATFVDKGRRAGSLPDIQNIREWAQAKGIGVGGTRREFYNTTWKIAQAIRDNGTIKRFGGNRQGSGFLDQVIEQLRPAMTEDFRKAIRIDIEESIRKPQQY